MKSLDEIKYEVAVLHGFSSWGSLKERYEGYNSYDNAWLIVCQRYATEVSRQLRIDIAAKLPTEVNKDIVLNTEIKA